MSNVDVSLLRVPVTADVANLMMVLLVDETSRNINIDMITWWKVTGKEQDPTLAYTGCGGGGAGSQCPFLPFLGGSWKLNCVTFSACLTQTHFRTSLKK